MRDKIRQTKETREVELGHKALFMLCRWDVRAYDIGLLMAALDYVLDLMGFDSRFMGCRFGRPPRLYVKALVLKEVCKASLRYAESLSKTHLGVKIPKSTLHYWEVRHGEIDYD
jgi:hypothetical protein